MQIRNSYFTCVGEAHALETLPVPAYTRQVEARAGASAASARRKEDTGNSISWTSAACFWSQKKSVWSVDVRLDPAALLCSVAQIASYLNCKLHSAAS